MPPAKKAKLSLPRQKACSSCADAKVRCDHGSPCARCRLRSLKCTYAKGSLHSDLSSLDGGGFDGGGLVEANDDPRVYGLLNDASILTPIESPATVASVDDLPPRPVYSTSQRSDLVCNIDAAKIQVRWLRSLVSDPGDRPKVFPPSVVNYVSRILKSYVSSVVHNSSVPPFIHATQLDDEVTNQPLTMALRLLRICDRRLPGSRELASEPLDSEMRKILSNQDSYDARSLLAAFQAYLLYSMTLLFEFGQLNHPNLREAVFNLQQLASAAASDGVVTGDELRQSRPAWDSWVLAEAKRRTLYTFYLFDNILCIKSDVPIFIGSELHGLMTPAAGPLWRAGTGDEWQTAYNAYLARWDSPGLSIDELWPAPSGSSEAEIQARTTRVDRWLEGADEFGVMLYAVTSATFGD